jgi:putative CocE/NonD family hydrolase
MKHSPRRNLVLATGNERLLGMRSMRVLGLLLLSFLAALAMLWLQPVLSAQAPGVVVENDVGVPMRDGVTLRADVLRPHGPGPFPVLVYRTPYGKRDAQESYTTFRRAVERGYAVVVQDVRGRYTSESEFRPYENEGKDGYDTIEWAARQPWSNAAVGTFGLSYPGAVQWLAAVESPPHLKAMVPAMTFSTPRNFFYSGGVADLSWIGWIWNNILPDVRVRKNVAGPKTHDEARAEWAKIRDRVPRFLPVADLPELKELAPYYADWWRHPPNDPWWEWCELRNKYARVQAAVLNLSGWYDEAYGPEGATTNFLGLLAARKGQAPRTQLLIGPWRHGVEETAETRVGERDFGSQAAINYDEVVLAWMDRHVKGISTGWNDKKPVRVFVMGRNEWTESTTWPLPGTTRTSFYLAAPRGDAKIGGLQKSVPAAADSFRSVISDPENPVVDPQSAYSGPQDYSALAQRRDVLVYETPPLDGSVEVTGPITAEIFLACDCPDTDLWVRLLDVSPAGKALSLMSPGLDVIRASFREPGGERSLLTPGRVYRLELRNLVTSNVFRKGHRIRIQVSASLFPNFSRNLHTGELETTSAKMRKATVRIFHDKSRPSRLILPVLNATAAQRR